MLAAPTAEKKAEATASKTPEPPQIERAWEVGGADGAVASLHGGPPAGRGIGMMAGAAGRQGASHTPSGRAASRAPIIPLRPSQGGLIQRKCACGGAPGPTGECEACHTERLGIQTKLTVNQPGDAYEHEADRVAEQVMRMPQAQLQRSGDCPGGCSDHKAEEPAAASRQAQLKVAGPGDVGGTEAPAIVHEALRSAGHPLDAATRTFMESRFRHDFGSVRVHMDTRAAQSARAVNALAYTVGSDIVFGEGRYDPGTIAGRGLLAHELAHTVQQGASHHSLSRLTLGRPRTAPEEREADRVRAEILSGSGVAGIHERVAPTVARDEGSPAGGCGVCYGTPALAGTAVHALASEAFRELGFEAPYGQSRDLKRPKLAPSPTDENFVLDLVKPVGAEGLAIGEIKPANPAGLLQGDTDLFWYEKQLKGFGFTTRRSIFPPPLDPIPFPTLAPDPCPEFQNLYINAPAHGIYTYYCTPDFAQLVGQCPCKRKQEQKESKAAQVAQIALHAGQEIARRTVEKQVKKRAAQVAEAVVGWEVATPLAAAAAYVAINAPALYALSKVSQRAEAVEELEKHLAEFESGARKLRTAVDQQRIAESKLPDDPLEAGESGTFVIGLDELEFVNEYKEAAEKIAGDAAKARDLLDNIIKGWDAALKQVEATGDFTKKRIWEDVTLLDLRFSNEGGRFRTYLTNARDDANRVMDWAWQKRSAAKSILDSANLPFRRLMGEAGAIRRELAAIAAKGSPTAGVLVAIDYLTAAETTINDEVVYQSVIHAFSILEDNSQISGTDVYARVKRLRDKLEELANE